MSWLLPTALPAAPLPPGRYWLPWALGPADQDRLVDLVFRMQPQLTHRVQLPWAAVELPRRLVRPERCLVVVDVAPDVGPEARHGALDALGGAVQLLRPPEPRFGLDGWQAEHLRPALAHAIHTAVRAPDHPLAPLGIAHLPVDMATDLTHDVVTLVDLLEGTVAHRLRYASLGMDPEEWRESLQHTAGRWLADRVLRLAGGTLRHAVALLMAGPERMTEVEGFVEGGQGLARLGLASVQHHTVRLGPLARRLDDVFIRGAFLDRMPAEAFSEQARRYVMAGEMAPSRGGSDLDVPVRRSGDLLWRSVIEALELERARASQGAEPAAAAAAEAGLQLLAELSLLPAHVEGLSVGLTERVRAALLAGEPFALDGTPLARLLHLLAALLRFTSARGARELATRDQAALSLDLLVRPDDPEAYRVARGAVTAELAWDLALSAPDRAALEAVDARCDRVRRQLPPGSPAALSLQGVMAWLAERRGDLALAEAMHAERQAGYEALGAEREVAVTRGRLARLKVGRCELEPAEVDLAAALATFERLGAQHDVAVAQGDIARLRARQGRVHEALHLHRQRLRILERQGARRDRAQAKVDIARLLAREKRFDEALALLRPALEDFEHLRDRQGEGGARGAMARILAARGEFDEAISLHRQALRSARALGEPAMEADARLALGELELQRAARAQEDAGRTQHLRAARAELGAAFRLARAAHHGDAMSEAAAAYAQALMLLGQMDDARRFVAAVSAPLRAAGRPEVAQALEALVGGIEGVKPASLPPSSLPPPMPTAEADEPDPAGGDQGVGGP